MNTYSHPVLGITLLVATCAAIASNALLSERSSEQPKQCAADAVVPAQKPLPSSALIERHAAMIGNWVGESLLDSGEWRRFLVQRSPDGTFVVTFKTRRGEQVSVEQEMGLWGISGPIYFTITSGWIDGDLVQWADPRQPHLYDAYKIINFEGDYFEYESLAVDARFVLRRAAEDFSPDDL